MNKPYPFYHYTPVRVNRSSNELPHVYRIERRLNWGYIATRAAVAGLFFLGAAALSAELYLLAGLIPQIIGGAA
jgi:hypothetical protein